MGRPDIARIQSRDAVWPRPQRSAIRRFSVRSALRESSVAKAQADQERVIAELRRRLVRPRRSRYGHQKNRSMPSQSRRQQATADKAYEIQTNIMQAAGDR